MADFVTFEAACALVLAGRPVIHRSWPRLGWRCYMFERDGAVWFRHSDGREEPIDQAYRKLVGGSFGWTTDLVD